MVAIGGSDSVETEIEVAREFSREKKLPLVEVDFQNTRQVGWSMDEWSMDGLDKA